MAKERYCVDYHVTSVCYLEPGLELPGPDLARLWSGTRIFGSQVAIGDFWHSGNVPLGNRRLTLGDTNLLQPLLHLSSMPIYGGGVCVQSRSVARNVIMDRDFYYAHTPASRSFGYATKPFLLYAVSGPWFENAGPDNVVAHIREHFEVADRLRAPYGLIDLSHADDCYGGAAYDDSSWVGNIPLHRCFEHVKWLYTRSQRSDQARGVYWGNYFGAEILDRLGGRGPFLTRFRQQARYADDRPSARIWEFDNGVLVTLCLDPLDCKPGQPLDGWATQNMHWLMLELGSQGVLNPWSERPADRSVS